MKLLTVLLVLLLTACEQSEPTTVLDQCLRADLFKQCLAQVPKGPVSTVENPWHKVVDECESAAYRQSWRKTATVKLECRSQ
jgi:hypothetical protein